MESASSEIAQKINGSKNKKLKIGMIFPGQGSQFLGMGKEFYNENRTVQELFEDASACMGKNFVKLCFASSEELLRGTIETQTAVFLVSVSIFSVLKEKYGIVPDLVAGHSLGEYSAVFAAGGMNFADSIYLLSKRAKFMEEAVKNQDGGLLAVLGFPEDKLRKICEQYDKPDTLTNVAEIGCFNSPEQLVVSGTIPELELIAQDIEMLRGKAVMLPIKGGFHSRLLHQAEQLFSQYLLKVDFNKLNIPLVSNVTAQKITSAESVKLSLVRQTSSRVRWWESMKHFEKMDLIVEIGPNDKLAKMIKREWPDKPIVSINSLRDLDKFGRALERLDPNLQCCFNSVQ